MTDDITDVAPIPAVLKIAGAALTAAIVAALIIAGLTPPRQADVAVKITNAFASLPAKGVRTAPIAPLPPPPIVVRTTVEPAIALKVEAPEPAPLPPPAETSKTVLPESDPEPEPAVRHHRRVIEDSARPDICARHGLHRVTVGRGWRCSK